MAKNQKEVIKNEDFDSWFDDMVDETDYSCDGFYQPKFIKQEVKGTLVGFFQSKKRVNGQIVVVDYAKIKLVAVCEAIKTSESQKTSRTVQAENNQDIDLTILEPGQILGVKMNAKLSAIKNYVTGSKVWFRPLGKKKISDQNSIWDYALKIGGKKLANNTVQDETSDDDGL